MFVNYELLPKVSIITVCYNSAKSIEQTIVSVLQQSYSNIEYIIIDGGSTDDTVNIIKKYEQHLAYWISEKDAGIADAWNKGISRANGKIIGIINSDDFYYKEAVEQAVKAFQQHPECGFVYADLEVINELTGDKHIEKGHPNYESYLAYDMLHLPHPTVFVKADVYDQCGNFNINYNTALDYEFIRRITYKGIKGAYFPGTVACMREGGASDVQRMNAFREVLRASIQYGYPRYKAFAYFLFKCSRTYAGYFLNIIGINVASRRWLRNVITNVFGAARKK